MKHRKALKRRMNNLLRDIQCGYYQWRKNWMSIGYINNRPRSFPPLADTHIGRVENWRFITSKEAA